MFNDVDDTLKALLQIALGDPLPFNLSFAIPDRNFKPLASDKNTLNCYLYDIRENRDLRSIEPTLVRNSDGTVEKTYPPLRVKLSYCITAWSPAQAPVDPVIEEHKLLGQVLALLLRYPALPPQVLQGGLAGQEPPLPTSVVLPEDMKSNRDFWNAVGGPLRPALDYSITAALAFQPSVKGPMMTTAQICVVSEPSLYLIGGTVRDSSTPPQALAGVWVRVQQTGQSGISDSDGRFRIDPLPPGTYTLTARAAGFHDASRSVTVPQPDRLYDLQMVPL